VSDDAYEILIEEKFSSNIADLVSRILTEIINNGVVINKDILLKESDKAIILRDVETKSEKVVYNLKSFYNPDQAKIMVRIIGQPLLKDMNYNLINLVVDFVQKLIQPNIILNTNRNQAGSLQNKNRGNAPPRRRNNYKSSAFKAQKSADRNKKRTYSGNKYRCSNDNAVPAYLNLHPSH